MQEAITDIPTYDIRMYTDEFDTRLLHDNNGDGIYNYLESEITRKFVLERNGDTVIDIGAHIGYFTCIMARYSEEVGKRVMAFEPSSYNFQLLKKNIQLNNFKNVEIFQAAVTNVQNGTVDLHLSPESTGMNRIYPSKWCEGGKVETAVKTVRIDSMINTRRHKVDFIKMDIEGSEFGALLGMQELLIKQHPVLMMEFHPPSIEEYGTHPRKIYDFLRNTGYHNIALVPNRQGEGISKKITRYDDLYRWTCNSTSRNLLCRV